jgi:hypothetical protein
MFMLSFIPQKSRALGSGAIAERGVSSIRKQPEKQGRERSGIGFAQRISPA